MSCYALRFAVICAFAAEILCGVGHDASITANAMPRGGELRISFSRPRSSTLVGSTGITWWTFRFFSCLGESRGARGGGSFLFENPRKRVGCQGGVRPRGRQGVCSEEFGGMGWLNYFLGAEILTTIRSACAMDQSI